MLPGPQSKVLTRQEPAQEAPKAATTVAIYASARAADDDGAREQTDDTDVSVGDGIDAITPDARLQTRVVNALAALERVRKTDQVGARRPSRKHRGPATRRPPFMESPLRLAVSSSSNMPRDVNHASKDGPTAEASEEVSLSRELEADAPSGSGYQVR